MLTKKPLEKFLREKIDNSLVSLEEEAKDKFTNIAMSYTDEAISCNDRDGRTFVDILIYQDHFAFSGDKKRYNWKSFSAWLESEGFDIQYIPTKEAVRIVW